MAQGCCGNQGFSLLPVWLFAGSKFSPACALGNSNSITYPQPMKPVWNLVIHNLKDGFTAVRSCTNLENQTSNMLLKIWWSPKWWGPAGSFAWDSPASYLPVPGSTTLPHQQRGKDSQKYELCFICPASSAHTLYHPETGYGDHKTTHVL